MEQTEKTKNANVEQILFKIYGGSENPIFSNRGARKT